MEHRFKEMPKQKKEKVQARNDVIIVDKLKHCPECNEKNIISPVERLQYEEDRYWLFCTGGGCSFLKDVKGKAVVTEEDLILHGLPGQLINHMDIFYEDINKIVRLCMSEYIKMKYLEYPMIDFNFESVEHSVSVLVESHGFEGSIQLTEVTKTKESDSIVDEDLPNLNELERSDLEVEDLFDILANHSLLSDPLGDLSNLNELERSDLKVEEDLFDILGNHSPLGDQSLQCANSHEYISTTGTQQGSLWADFEQQFQPTGQLDLDNFAQNLDLTKINDGRLTLSENQESKFLHKLQKSKQNKACKSFDSKNSMRKLADSLVEDLPISYQEKVKAAFSKIKEYNFPEDFANGVDPKKQKFFKILKERRRQKHIKAETKEQLKGFVDEYDGLTSLFK